VGVLSTTCSQAELHAQQLPRRRAGGRELQLRCLLQAVLEEQGQLAPLLGGGEGGRRSFAPSPQAAAAAAWPPGGATGRPWHAG